MKLAVFHYHFLPGGVTEVVKSSAAAALANIAGLEEICLVTGREDKLQNVLSEIKDSLTSSGISPERIKSEIIKEIGYLSETGPRPDPEIVRDILQKRFGGYIWWVHNYHIGKNPYFTEALLSAASESRNQKIVFHIHDFPEESRYRNLSLIKETVTLPLYPVSDNVRYAVINTRDYKYLIDSGLPEEMVFLLNNPVDTEKPAEEHSGVHKKEIDRILSEKTGSYIPGAPLALYPVRAIRRKNVLEAALVTECAETDINLAVTLPGVSESEKAYSELVDSIFREKLVSGASGTGPLTSGSGIGFRDMINASDIITASSVQEGFGYLYINSILWNKPVFARDLAIMEGIKHLFSKGESFFYTGINIPVSRELKSSLENEYSEKLAGLEPFLGPGITSGLKGEFKEMFSGGTADFSFLSTADQKQYLKKIKTGEFRKKEIRQLNRELFLEFGGLIARGEISSEPEGLGEFSLASHGKSAEKILDSFGRPLKGMDETPDISSRMLIKFANTGSARLLYNLT